MPHGKWLIPTDWSLETGQWEHYCIAWPRSWEWYIQLKSLMFALTRGREWDELSGTIATAQAIGWEIFNKNHLLLNLCGEQDNSSEPQNGASGAFGAGSAYDGEEDNQMGQVVTDVTIVDGKLTVWFGPCCSKTLDGFVTGPAGQDLGDDPLNPTHDPDFTYSACGKAWAIVDIVYKIIQAAWDEIDTLPDIFSIIPHIESFVGYDLDNNHLIDLMSNVVASDGFGYSAADFQDASDKQRILCRLVSLFANDAAGVPDSAMFETIRSIFYSEVNSAMEFTAATMFNSAVNALGRVDMDTAAKLGAGDATRDCDCGGGFLLQETTPDANGWYLGVDRHAEVTTAGGYGAMWIGTPPEDVYGVFMRLNTPPDANPTKRMSIIDFQIAHPEIVVPLQDDTVFANTSDHLEAMNQSYPIIQLDSQPIAVSLAAQAGATGFTKVTGTVDGTVIATPDWPVSESRGAYISTPNLGDPGMAQPGFVIEFRFIHNTNSPSHA